MLDDDDNLIIKPKRKKAIRPTAIVALGFFVMILLGAFLLCFPAAYKDGKWASFTDSFFTATSAVCVTGLSLLDPAVDMTIYGQVVLLLLIQAGGLGFMTLATIVFLMIGKRITLKDRLALQEAMGETQIKGIVRLVRNIVIMTVSIELIGALMLMPFFIIQNGGIGAWQALFLSVSSFCNAGFDILGTSAMPNSSLEMYSSNAGVLLIVALLVTLGGFGFTVINDVFNKKFRFRRYSLHTKLVLVISLILFLFGTFFYLGSEFNSPATSGMNGGEKFLNAIFQSVTVRTAGFSAMQQGSMSNAGQVITWILMFIGASPGGTGGGIKSTTFAVLVMLMISGILGKRELVINKRSIEVKTGFRAVSIAFMALCLISVSAIIIMLIETNQSISAIMFETFSAFGTVGLSTGITPYLATGSKWILIITMFVGRLGVISLGMFIRHQTPDGIKYPSANIMIG